MVVTVLVGSQCTFWCLVLSDVGFGLFLFVTLPSLNAPSGAWCFSTKREALYMLVALACLNAPSGAWCFPTVALLVDVASGRSQCTFWCLVLSDLTRRVRSDRQEDGVSMHLLVLGAFRLDMKGDTTLRAWLVSMHLLVLGAFRPDFEEVPAAYIEKSQCTFWCLVLSDAEWIGEAEVERGSQCTFWCLVLSDSTPRKQRHNAAYRSEIAADLESTTLDRLTPLQLNHTTAENRHKQPQRHRHPLPTSTPPASNKPKPKTTTSRLLIGNYFDDLL